MTDIAKARVPLNWAQFIMVIFFTVSSTFTLTIIYSEFELMKVLINEVDAKVEKYNIDTNKRLDTKTKRNSDAIEKSTGKKIID